VKPDLKPYKATPVESRKYTQPKTRKCDDCRGKGADHDGAPCGVCGATGKLEIEPSRLYSGQRETDETAEEYSERCASAILGALDEYIVQIEVPRTEAERESFAVDVVTTARLISLTRSRGIADRNDDACHGKYGTPCEYWAHCSGVASLDDPTQFRRGEQHEELPGTHKQAAE